ncbi:DUF6702 family protein [Flagellimonas eckloniae]|nr:DUF6702 family protein [Allomuricauda eckloniae]
MIKNTVLILTVMLLFSFTTLHKYYLSVTNMQYSEKNDSFQITSRIFIDDLEEVLKERYGIIAELATSDEAKVSNAYIEKYFRTKFAIELNGEIAKYTFLGKKYEEDVVICYLELNNINFTDLQSISIQNEILTDLFEEQQNVVHLKWKGQKKSFVLIKENNKGMLNF